MSDAPDLRLPPLPAGALEGKVALVTGASRGIGRAIAEELARAGARLGLLARSAEGLRETAELIEQQGGHAFVAELDISDKGSVAKAVESCARELGPVDVLVNNAARTKAIGPVWDVDVDEWWRDVNVTLRGTFLMSNAVLPGMMARASGRIVNIAGGGVTAPHPYYSAYACAKVAVVRLTDTANLELEPHGVRLFAMSPGAVRTAMTEYALHSDLGRKWRADWYDALEDMYVPPDYAARLATFLASGAGDALAGMLVNVSDDVEDLLRRADELRAQGRRSLTVPL